MSLEELRHLIARHARADMTTPIKGVLLARHGESTHAPSMSGTVMALIAQGAKRIALGGRLFEYRSGQYLIASVDLPVTGQFLDATPQHPALGFGLVLRPASVAELLLQVAHGDIPAGSGGTVSSMAVSDAPAEMLDAVVRLLRLLDQPRDVAVLAPLFIREIIWRLIVGEQGSVVRQLGLADSSLNHIARAVQWIRDHYAEAFRVEDVAHLSGMSISAFYRNFQAVTAMSPIQFQKRIRLQQARLELAANPSDIGGAAFRVGYESPSQFSREYRRLFGTPPSQDAAGLRGMMHDSLPTLV
ncbi:MAG: AraC family transcriptional regulator [Sphingomonas sp.]|uniref:AraC family transcriptional regulator n=1 Tax=Sphingomonas sp. TaxID=28214 RepID=UPI0035619F90